MNYLNDSVKITEDNTTEGLIELVDFIYSKLEKSASIDILYSLLDTNGISPSKIDKLVSSTCIQVISSSTDSLPEYTRRRLLVDYSLIGSIILANISNVEVKTQTDISIYSSDNLELFINIALQAYYNSENQSYRGISHKQVDKGEQVNISLAVIYLIKVINDIYHLSCLDELISKEDIINLSARVKQTVLDIKKDRYYSTISISIPDTLRVAEKSLESKYSKEFADKWYQDCVDYIVKVFTTCASSKRIHTSVKLRKMKDILDQKLALNISSSDLDKMSKSLGGLSRNLTDIVQISSNLSSVKDSLENLLTLLRGLTLI